MLLITWYLCPPVTPKPQHRSKSSGFACGHCVTRLLPGQAYNLALGRYSRLARQLLPASGGYECKEPEPGKFTLAFP